jgi:threonyl-tRNA synthetase
MIHRALLGAIERFFAVLLENCGGHFALWLAPEQVRVIPVKDAHRAYAEQVRDALAARNLRVHVDESNRPMGAKIRAATLDKVPYALVVGDKEIAQHSVTVRLAGGQQVPALALDEFVTRVCAERDTRAQQSPWAQPPAL